MKLASVTTAILILALTGCSGGSADISNSQSATVSQTDSSSSSEPTQGALSTESPASASSDPLASIIGQRIGAASYTLKEAG